MTWLFDSNVTLWEYYGVFKITVLRPRITRRWRGPWRRSREHGRIWKRLWGGCWRAWTTRPGMRRTCEELVLLIYLKLWKREHFNTRACLLSVCSAYHHTGLLCVWKRASISMQVDVNHYCPCGADTGTWSETGSTIYSTITFLEHQAHWREDLTLTARQVKKSPLPLFTIIQWSAVYQWYFHGVTGPIGLRPVWTWTMPFHNLSLFYLIFYELILSNLFPTQA